jgi:hypothetical protein
MWKEAVAASLVVLHQHPSGGIMGNEEKAQDSEAEIRARGSGTERKNANH